MFHLDYLSTFPKDIVSQAGSNETDKIEIQNYTNQCNFNYKNKYIVPRDNCTLLQKKNDFLF